MENKTKNTWKQSNDWNTRIQNVIWSAFENNTKSQNKVLLRDIETCIIPNLRMEISIMEDEQEKEISPALLNSISK